MKNYYLAVLFVTLFSVSAVNAADLNPISRTDDLISSKLNPIVLLKTVKSKMVEHSKEVKIEVQNYDEAAIKNVYLSHKRKSKKSGKVDVLLIRGSVKNLTNHNMSGITVSATLKDDVGQVVSKKSIEAIPRIIRSFGRKKASFTIEVPYDENISLCKLDISWHGKSNLY